MEVTYRFSHQNIQKTIHSQNGDGDSEILASRRCALGVITTQRSTPSPTSSKRYPQRPEVGIVDEKIEVYDRF